MNLKDFKDIAETALRIVRVVASMPPQRQLEVMAVAQTMITIGAQSAMRPPPQQEVKDE